MLHEIARIVIHGEEKDVVALCREFPLLLLPRALKLEKKDHGWLSMISKITGAGKLTRFSNLVKCDQMLMSRSGRRKVKVHAKDRNMQRSGCFQVRQSLDSLSVERGGLARAN